MLALPGKSLICQEGWRQMLPGPWFEQQKVCQRLMVLISTGLPRHKARNVKPE